MKTYTEQEFIKLVNSEKDVNFIAEAVTPWHALGVEATIYHLQQQGIHLKGYIICTAHGVTGLGINENSFQMKKNQEIHIILLESPQINRTVKEKLTRRLHKYKYYISNSNDCKNNNILYWARPLNPEYDMLPLIDTKENNRKVVTILTDEGLGTYLNNELIWIQCSFQEGGIKSGFQAVMKNLISNKFFMHRLQARRQISYNQLLMRNSGQWIPNEEAIQAYQAILRQGKADKDYSNYSNSVIINTGLYQGIYKNNSDLRALEVVCKELKKKNVHVIVKPHPRDKEVNRFQILECEIEELSGIAQEVIFSGLQEKPYCVIGFDSTTLVSAKLLFDIEAISINVLINSNDLYEGKHFNLFNKMFGDIIQIPKKKADLMNILKEIGVQDERCRKNVENI